MRKELKMNLWWSFFITVFAVLYAVVYNLLPLKNPIMWCTYVSLPIFFLSGGNVRDVPKIAICSVCGFLWGVFCLWLMAATAGLGTFPSLIIGVFVSVLLCCSLHMGFAVNTILGCCPAVFGGFAVCFATGGTNGLTTCCTLAAGAVIGGVMAVSGQWSAKLAGITQ